MKSFKLTLLAAAAAGIALLAAPQSARATLILESTQPGFNFNPTPGGPTVSSILFADNNAFGSPGTIITFLGRTVLLGADNDPTLGSLTIAGPGGAGTPLQVGAFQVTGSASQSNSPGTPTNPVVESLTTTSLNVVNNSGATATQQVVVSDTNFAALVGGTMASTAAGTILGTGSVAVTTTDSSSNALGAGTTINPTPGGTTIFGFNGTTFTTGTYSQNVTVPIPFTATMSKSIEFDLTLGAGASLSSRTNGITNIGAAAVPGVPEPTTLISAVLGLGFMGGATWMRRRKSA